MQWLNLSLAIVSEVIATSSLPATKGFTRPGPTLVVVAGYVLAFYLLSLTVPTIPVGVVYAVWSGVGVALVTLIAWIAYGQRLDLPALAGIGLIVAGVIVLHLFSRTLTH